MARDEKAASNPTFFVIGKEKNNSLGIDILDGRSSQKRNYIWICTEAAPKTIH
jgi:hypothetical protein